MNEKDKQELLRQLDRNRVISVSPCTVSKEYRGMDCDLRDCAECRKEFWMKEVE